MAHLSLPWPQSQPAVQQTWPVAARGVMEKVWMDLANPALLLEKPTELIRVGQSSHLQPGGAGNEWVRPLDIMTNSVCVIFC